MAYGDNLWYWKHARVGWELGFDLLPISITDNFPSRPPSISPLTSSMLGMWSLCGGAFITATPSGMLP